MKNPEIHPPANSPRNLPLPGMAAISLWMLALSIVGVTGVLTGRYPATAAKIAVLILSTFFAVGALGLLRRRRWGWALTLGAIVLSLALASYSLVRLHQLQWSVMALADLVFLLYLVRPQVIERLK